MSHVGTGANLIQPNKQCMSCKYWEPASKSYLGFLQAVAVKLDIVRKGVERNDQNY